uniref:Internal scaffolding protein n=1 Tax=Dulem virus 226 TaxID=3145703 RepID=A0AAU8B0Q9_9VIRU
MRNFAYIDPDHIRDDNRFPTPEGNPLYQPSVYDSVMFEETQSPDSKEKNYSFMDMTGILLNQEKYRRILGDMNVDNILSQMHPTRSTVMDGMTDEERFACVISRHCQTVSERQAVLKQLADEKSSLTAYAQAMLQMEEDSATPAKADAPASSE